MDKKIKAPIDNKNVLDDFIYINLFNDNYLTTPKHNGTTCNIIGYYNDKLLEARWNFGSNRLCLAFISTNESHVANDIETPKLKAYFDEISRSQESDIIVESFISGCWLICDLYFKD